MVSILPTRKGLVHRDVKPANALLSEKGTAKVTDFGLAVAKAPVEGVLPPRPDADTFLPTAGTPQYFAPEQAAGGPVGFEADIWAWGLVVLEMFKGGRTWESGTVAAEALREYMAAGSDDTRLPRLPPALGDILSRCFALSPRDRPRDLGQVAHELRTVFREVTGRPYRRLQPTAGLERADSLNNRAVSLMDLNRTSQAEESWQQALESEPLHVETTYNYGLVRWRKAEQDDAVLLRGMDQVRQAHFDLWSPAYLSGMLHLERGDFKAALSEFKKLPPGEAPAEEIQTAVQAAQTGFDRFSRAARRWTAHKGGINALWLNSQGKRAISAGEDGRIIIWDLENMRRLRSFGQPDYPVRCLGLIGNGPFLLAGGGSRLSAQFSLMGWNPSQGSKEMELAGHLKPVSCLDVSPDGRTVVSGAGDGLIFHWNPAEQRIIRRLAGGHDGAITALRFTSVRHILSAGADRIIRLWDLESGKCLRMFEGHEGRINAICHWPEKKAFLTASLDQTIRLWSLERGELMGFKGHTGEINDLARAGQGEYFVSGANDGTVRLWDAAEGRCLRTIEIGDSWVRSVGMSRSGGMIIAGGLDGYLNLWKTVPPEDRFKAPLMLAGVTSTEKSMQAAKIYEESLQAAEESLVKENFEAAAESVRKARAQIGFRQSSEAMSLWHRLYLRLPHGALLGAWEEAPLIGSELGADAFQVSANAKWAVAGGMDRKVRVWDVETRSMIYEYPPAEAAVTGLELVTSRDGVLVGGADGSLRLLGLTERREAEWSLEAGHDFVRALALSPCERYAFSGGDDGLIKIWDLARAECLGELDRHRAPIHALAVSPDGRFLLSSGGMFTGEKVQVILWNLADGSPAATLGDQDRIVNEIRFCPETRTAITAGSDGTVKLWDLESGSSLYAFAGHESSVNSVDVSADGRFAISGDAGGQVKIWDLASRRSLWSFKGRNRSMAKVRLSRDGRYCFFAGAAPEISLRRLDWDLRPKPAQSWEEGLEDRLKGLLINPHLTPLFFSTEQQPAAEDVAAGLNREEVDFVLGCIGYGWLETDDVLSRLKQAPEGRPNDSEALAGRRAADANRPEASEASVKKNWFRRLFFWKK